MGATRQKIGHKEREGGRKRSHKERRRQEGQEGETEREREVKEQYPEIQASINGSERTCTVAANSERCINTGLVLGCPSKSAVCV